ncbi:MAG: VWA domain-containing protein [Spirochaetales bacterium]|nr:VWA domain-containing protein [Spirochaetales bacterium]
MIEFRYPQNLYWIFLMIPIVVVSIFFFIRKIRLLKILKLVKDIKKIILIDFFSIFALNLAIFFMIFALAGPYRGKELVKKSDYGRDVVFLLDVSNSMLAEDLYPNRLQQAKQAIKDCIESFSGNRVALVAFGGNAVIKVPFTTDYIFFEQALYELSPDAVSRGGTRLGDALRRVDNLLFVEEEQRYRDIVLITDGEDQESYPTSIASRLADKGVRILIVGLGNEEKGGLIPISGENGKKEYLRHNGELVYTKFDPKVLKDIAAVSKNIIFVNVGDNRVDLGSIFKEFIKKGELKKVEGEDEYSYNMIFSWFLAVSLLLVLVSATIRRQLLL